MIKESKRTNKYQKTKINIVHSTYGPYNYQQPIAMPPPCHMVLFI